MYVWTWSITSDGYSIRKLGWNIAEHGNWNQTARGTGKTREDLQIWADKREEAAWARTTEPSWEADTEKNNWQEQNKQQQSRSWGELCGRVQVSSTQTWESSKKRKVEKSSSGKTENYQIWWKTYTSKNFKELQEDRLNQILTHRLKSNHQMPSRKILKAEREKQVIPFNRVSITNFS